MSARDYKLASGLALGGVYAGFATWAYFAWYRKPVRDFRVGGDGTWKLWTDDGWLSKKWYAGGADKLGHTWATLALGRLGTELLRIGGHGTWSSALVGMGLSELLFFAVEIGDGYQYTYSHGDFWFNTAGALLGFAQSVWPSVDELIDFRVDYFPSGAYRDRAVEKGDINIAEDYSGQTYLLAFHLGGIKPLREWKYGAWSQFVDVSIGFKTRGYKPDPLYKVDPNDPEKQDFDKTQTTFVGLSFNAQGAVDYLLRSGTHETIRKVGHAAFEVFSIPWTTLPVAGRTVRPDGIVPDEQE